MINLAAGYLLILYGVIAILFPKETLSLYYKFKKSVGTKLNKGQISVGFWRAQGIIAILVGLIIIKFIDSLSL